MILPFGKYKGQELYATPTSYLKWFEENANPSIQLRDAINAELRSRDSEETSIGSVESPSRISLEELFFKEIKQWLINEDQAERLSIYHATARLRDQSLMQMLKNEVPRILKLYREQGK